MDFTAAGAFYRLFCALPKKDQLAVARYILQEKEIKRLLAPIESPNQPTRKSFAETKEHMPVFTSIDDLRDDLLS